MKRFVAIALLLFGSFSLFAQQWEIKIDIPSVNLDIEGGDVNNNGMSIIAGSYDSVAWIGMASEIGEFQEQSFPIEGMRTVFHDARFINDDTVLALGFAVDMLSESYSLRIVLMNTDLQKIGDFLYPIDEECLKFIGEGKLLIDNDSTIIAAMPAIWHSPNPNINYPTICSFWRFSPSGIMLDCQYTKAYDHDPLVYFFDFLVDEIIKPKADSGFMVLGGGYLGHPSLISFDHDFNMTEYHELSYETMLDIFEIESFYSGYWFDDEHLLIVGILPDENPYISKPHIGIVKSDLQGNYEQEFYINRPDTAYYSFSAPSVAAANDSTIYILAACSPPGVWSEVIFAEIYIINKDMELLGRIGISEYQGAWPNIILRSHDDGCVIVGKDHKDYFYIRKYSREDFNPIPCSVKDVPKEQIKATVFPNPASDEIHFDISSLPTGKEHRISISDAMGRLVMSRIIRGEGNVLTIGISGFKSGIYTYQIYNAESEIVNGKFVKE